MVDTLLQYEDLEERVRRLEGRLNYIVDPTNNLVPEIFMRRSIPFNILPHEVASLRYATQAITSGTVYQTPAVSDPNAATFEFGMNINTANGTITVSGQPQDTTILFVLWWQWAGNATGRRAMQWEEVAAGNAVQDFEFTPNATIATYLHVSHIRRVASGDTTYRLQVYQNSGGDLNGDGLLVACRLR